MVRQLLFSNLTPISERPPFDRIKRQLLLSPLALGHQPRPVPPFAIAEPTDQPGGTRTGEEADDNRRSGLNVGSPLHSRPRSEGCRRSVHDPKPTVTGFAKRFSCARKTKWPWWLCDEPDGGLLTHTSPGWLSLGPSSPSPVLVRGDRIALSSMLYWRSSRADGQPSSAYPRPLQTGDTTMKPFAPPPSALRALLAALLIAFAIPTGLAAAGEILPFLDKELEGTMPDGARATRKTSGIGDAQTMRRTLSAWFRRWA